MKYVLRIEGMMCQRCVAHVEKALESTDGILSVEVNLKKNIATVTTAENNVEQTLANACQAVVDAGYEVKSVK